MIDVDNITADAVEKIYGLLPTVVALGSFVKNVEGHSADDYDPEEDVPISPLEIIPKVRMIKVAATAEELEGMAISVEDAKILIPGKDLPGYEPKTSDYLVYRGKEYNIVKVKPLPVDTLRIVYVRAR